MPRPKNEDIRIQLLEQGLQHLAEFGYHGTGIQEVLQAVGVPKGSFYNYFQSKEHFCAEIIRHFTKKIRRQFAEQVQRYPNDALAGLKAAFRAHLEAQQAMEFKPGCPVGNLTAEIGDTSIVCREAMREAWHLWQQNIATVLAQGQEEGSVRKDIEAREMANLLWSAWQGSLLTMKLQRSIRPLEQCIVYLLDGYFRPALFMCQKERS